ncbi:MAG TPA: endonuclease/exonuclease/phosphatase family protein [Candidatus Limnocylindrales bacterium]|nr:endonuclease/exonuclease/phosphatase family protein [Candidatus Limnocylindrales bacterium]
MTLRLLSYNIRFGGGERIPLIARVVSALEPDVVVLQEATNPHAVDRLASEAGFRHVLRRPGWSVAWLGRDAPRFHTWHRPIRSRGYLEVEPARSDLRIVGLHLPAGLSARGERARLRHVEAMLATLGGQADARTVLVGDLNAVSRGDAPRVARMPLWLRLLLHFDGGIRTDVLDRLGAAGWIDAYRRLHPDQPGFTLPPRAPQIRLDYLLVPEPLIGAVASCGPVADAPHVTRASDHLPLLSVLDV